jgi:hypothetical protein
MKKFLYKCVILCLLITGFFIIIILLPAPYNDYTQAIYDKHLRLQEFEAPRIVLAGGSNLAFGIDSEAIENTLQLPVVNMAISAGFGLGRILDDILPLLKAKDLLVIVPEYDLFEYRYNGDAAAYKMIFDTRRYELITHIPFYGIPSDFLGYIKIKLLGMIPHQPNPLAYSRDGLNEYGDYIKHLETKNLPFDTSPPLKEINSRYLRRFSRFTALLADRGIKVIVSYPSYEETHFHNSTQFIQELDAVLRMEKTIQVISTPQTYCFPGIFFYDTRYHLNAKGREIRTTLLIEDLQRYFEQ